MTELVINASNVVSPLCYSLLRLEPYTICVFNCVYCYARWYYRWGSTEAGPRPVALRVFERVARSIRRRGLLPIPIRLSTLVDPFQPPEEVFKVSLRAMEIALRYEYPLVINTKGVLLAREPWRGVAEKLGDRGLLLLQVSVTSLDERVSKLLEPHAPPPGERLRLLKEFADTGVPGVVRLSPYIPRVSAAPSPEELAVRLREFGAKLVIVKSLRLEKDKMPAVLRAVGAPGLELEPYSLREVPGAKPLVRPSLRVRLEEYSALRRALVKEGLRFATCKEGLFTLHTTPNCCGMHMFGVEVGYRPTLYELYRLAAEAGGIAIEKLGDALESICRDRRYLCGERLREYPREVSKPLRYHEKKLLRVAKDPEMLPRVAPALTIAERRVRAAKLPIP